MERTIARLQADHLGHPPADVWEDLPGEMRPDAEAADVTAQLQADAVSEGQLQPRADDRVEPSLGQGAVPPGRADEISAHPVVPDAGERLEPGTESVAQGGLD